MESMSPTFRLATVRGAQARPVGDRERRQMLQAHGGRPAAGGPRPAQDIGQAAGIAQPNQLAGEIGPVDCVDEEEAQRRDDRVHRRHAETGLLEGDLQAAQVLRRSGVGRAPEERGETSDVAQVVALRLGREAPHRHVGDQR